VADPRTRLQREADSLDCDLYRLICRAERMYDGIKKHTGPRVADFHKCLMRLRSARSGIRMLMHGDDRARTA
jgi:hypothetical protein